MSKKSAKIPSVRPHSNRGRLRSPESAWLLRHHDLKREISVDSLLFCSSGTNPGIEVHCTVSAGSNRTAENCIQPSIDRTANLVRNPPCLANRCDISTYSTVRRDEESSARNGIQCVEATSVGCSRSIGESLRVVIKTKGQRTINLDNQKESNQQSNIQRERERDGKARQRPQTYGTDPQLVVTTLSGKFPTQIQSSVVKSNPISSEASRIAAALSSSSSGSRFPPGKATCPVQRSPGREARLMKRTSGSPYFTHGWAKKSSSLSSTDKSGSPRPISRSVGFGQWLYVGRTRRIKATEARFLHRGGLGTCGYGCRWRSVRTL